MFKSNLSENARKRINILKNSNDGFEISEEDISNIVALFNEDFYIDKQMIIEAIKNKQLIKECQLLVRLHPIYFRRINGGLVFSRFFNNFEELVAI